MEENEEVFAIFVPNSPDRHIFKDLRDVKKFLDSPMGKTGTRFRRCYTNTDITNFFATQETNPQYYSTPSSSTTCEPVSPYRKLPIARLTEMRKAIEQKNNEKFEELLKENPRFIINTDIDSASILQEGFRFNAMHIACRSSNVYVVQRLLSLITNLNWLTHVFNTDSCVEERSNYLMDSLVNTPDLIENNTPLHYACKFPNVEIVELLLKLPNVKKHPKNKFNERPLDMLCRGFKGSESEKEELSSNINLAFYGHRPSSVSPRRPCGTPITLHSPNRTPSKSVDAKASPIRYTTSFTGPKLFDSPIICRLEAEFSQKLTIDSPKLPNTENKNSTAISAQKSFKITKKENNDDNSDSESSVYEDAIDRILIPEEFIANKNTNLCSIL